MTIDKNNRDGASAAGELANLHRRRVVQGLLAALPVCATLSWVSRRAPRTVVIRDGWILAKDD